MGRLKAVGFNDLCFAPVPVQPVTWRNWQEQGIDFTAFTVRVRNEIARIDLSNYSVGFGLDMIDSVPDFYRSWEELMGRGMNAELTKHGGIHPANPMFNLKASELVANWHTFGYSVKRYLVIAAWHAMSQHKSAFNRHHPQLQIAGFVAICYVLGVTTTTG